MKVIKITCQDYNKDVQALINVDRIEFIKEGYEGITEIGINHEKLFTKLSLSDLEHCIQNAREMIRN